MDVGAKGGVLRSERRLLGAHNHPRQMCSQARCCDGTADDRNLPSHLCRHVWVACDAHTRLSRIKRTQE